MWLHVTGIMWQICKICGAVVHLLFFCCWSSFSAICSLMAAVTILTSLVYVSQHLTITSKWHKWVCVFGTVSLQWKLMLMLIFGQWRGFTTQTPNPYHNPNVQEKKINPDWLTPLLMLLGSSAALLCWGSCLWHYGNIKSKLSVQLCPTVCAILGRS